MEATTWTDLSYMIKRKFQQRPILEDDQSKKRSREDKDQGIEPLENEEQLNFELPLPLHEQPQEDDQQQEAQQLQELLQQEAEQQQLLEAQRERELQRQDAEQQEAEQQQLLEAQRRRELQRQEAEQRQQQEALRQNRIQLAARQQFRLNALQRERGRNRNINYLQNGQFLIGDGLYIPSAAQREAARSDRPSEFITKMTHVIWPREELINKVVRRQKNTGDKQALTPRKVELLSYHFEEFLTDRNYSEERIQIELKKMNTYLGRAITSAKKKVVL
ncbi:hypothetical protein KQX54_007157 [Cotesia glomerata]|uniref:Uncharacterized protein n=1 Tax=Cotesia glomerata TaxID=32391 RepID=A0AAV7IC21_COTGL|nr:hypothetical protein KQX54_007157 [Cotesia glomerata]